MIPDPAGADQPRDVMTATQRKLAIHGGPRSVGEEQPKELFHWAIITSEDEEAVLDVLRAGSMGRPTVVLFGQRDVRQGRGSVPVSEKIYDIAFPIPWFKRDIPAIIETYAVAFRKVAE